MKIGLSHMYDRMLFGDWMRRLDAQAVLDFYGAENQTEVPGSDGTIEVVHSCLLDRKEPHHRNGDAVPSAQMNLERKLYLCHTMGWGGSLPYFVMRMERRDSLSETAPLMGRFLDGSTYDTEDFCERLSKALASPGFGDVELPSYSPWVLRPWAFVHPYLTSRGITEDTASELQIGFDERDNRIVFPVFWSGALVGWQKRAIPRSDQWPGTDSQFPKYKTSPGMPKSVLLYNYDRVQGCDHVVVVESPFSVAKAHSLGFTNVVATFGAKCSDTQIALLRAFPRVTVWFDADGAGRAGEARLVRGLWKHVHVDVVDSEEGRDLADCCTAEEVARKLVVAEPSAFAMARYAERS